MVAANVVRLSFLNKRPDIGALQVLEVIVVSSAQVGAHAAVVAGNDDATAAGGKLGVDAILDTEAGLLASVPEDRGVLVVAGAAQVDDAVSRKYVLGTTGRVLGGTAGNQLGIVVVEEVLVEVQVLLRIGEDSIIGLEAVLLEKCLIAEALDV